MSLRDWFAATATEEDIAEFLPSTVGEANAMEKRDGVKRTRQWAKFQHADAMLKAREQ